jgi:hypothetical protein
LSLLAFLAAGQTHQAKGPYRQNVLRGLRWLLSHQHADGDLSAATPPDLASHSLSTLTLSQAYGLTHHAALAKGAQQGIRFIQSLLAAEPGDRRSAPAKAPDPTGLAWRLLALRGAERVGLEVDAERLRAALEHLVDSLAIDPALAPGGDRRPLQVAIGLWARQLSSGEAARVSPAPQAAALMAHLPGPLDRDARYWFFATQLLHETGGAQWTAWNAALRKYLVETQSKDQCASGSWTPDKPDPDAFGEAGGRLGVTCLSTLALECYYQYLPIWKTRSRGENHPATEADKRPAAR